MTAPLIERLLSGGPVVTDGAWGTQMFSLGLARGEHPDLWNLTHPEQVATVARAYVDAGSRVILTNTFQSNRFALGAKADIAELNHAGAAISRAAAGDGVRVFGSIGPTNTMLVEGDVDEGELRAAFEEQACALAEGGADAIVLETMSDLAEAVLAVGAVRAAGLPVVACMTFDSGKRRDRTMTGITPAHAAAALTDVGADVVGANCGMGVDTVAPICAALAAATDVPVWIKANAGMPELAGRDVVYSMTPGAYAGHVGALVDAGARFIGGCCGTSPAFVAEIARVLDELVGEHADERPRSPVR